MSNCEVFHLPGLEMEPHQMREALRVVLHTILFNRALGQVAPRDVDSDLFDITYVRRSLIHNCMLLEIVVACGYAARHVNCGGGYARPLSLPPAHTSLSSSLLRACCSRDPSATVASQSGAGMRPQCVMPGAAGTFSSRLI